MKCCELRAVIFARCRCLSIDDEIRDLSAAVNRTAAMLAEYEEQVRRSEQMRTLTILGASIAHQLRNAATGCRMALDLHADECHATESRECLDVARRQLRLMESQLQRFLRVGKQPTEMVKRDVDLGDLMDELLPLGAAGGQPCGRGARLPDRGREYVRERR